MRVSGPGCASRTQALPPENLDRFCPVTDSMDRTDPGLSIGLYISHGKGVNLADRPAIRLFSRISRRIPQAPFVLDQLCFQNLDRAVGIDAGGRPNPRVFLTHGGRDKCGPSTRFVPPDAKLWVSPSIKATESFEPMDI